MCEVTRDLTVGLTTRLSSFLGRNLRLKICHKELVRPGTRLRGGGGVVRKAIVVKSKKDSQTTLPPSLVSCDCVTLVSKF